MLRIVALLLLWLLWVGDLGLSTRSYGRGDHPHLGCLSANGGRRCSRLEESVRDLKAYAASLFGAISELAITNSNGHRSKQIQRTLWVY
jgi:hypothetical protein